MLTYEQKQIIRHLYGSGQKSQLEIAALFKVTKSRISQICRGISCPVRRIGRDPLDPGIKASIIADYQAGLKPLYIAVKHGVSETTVHKFGRGDRPKGVESRRPS